ncbi:autoinducer binding domain-containing protein [Cupriavidus sp. WS]|uniref:autoinducer binding domain-containing protein n=1 Tax=Cupriavidus sp. WS TaxID=1312922 RepID=UPI00039A0DE6|nr:autoinducer binding domain-containing protein [Cupriavidus sp. WS]
MYSFEVLFAANSQEEVGAFLHRPLGNLGFGYFFYLPLIVSADTSQFFESDEIVVPPEHLGAKRIVNAYPDSWVLRYQEAGHVAVDPIVKSATSGNLPIHWDVVERQTGAHRVPDEAREHGLLSGITIPISSFDGNRALFSAASDTVPDKSRRHAEMLSNQVLLTAIYLHEALLKLDAPPADAATPKLTPREKVCLQWAGLGKTSWEILQILSIAERTVVFHIGNATRKLRATNHRQAVVRAVRRRIISI